MDYRHLIESTTEYGIDKLKQGDKEFVEGMRKAVSDDVLERFLACQEDELDIPESMAKMYMDIAKDVVSHLKWFVETDAAELQVCLIDGYEEPEDE